MKKLILSSLVVALSYMTALPAVSQTFSDKVYARLMILDQEVSHGHLHFDRRCQFGMAKSYEKHEFVFNSEHHYKNFCVLSDAMHSRLVKYFDGTDSFIEAGGSIVIEAGLPREADYDQSLMDVTSYPCFPMGRGLSSLKAFTALRRGKWVEVKGHTLRGIYVTAKIDPNAHDLAREIEMRDAKGGWEGFWRTYGESSRGAIASKSIYTPSNSNASQNLTFTFTHSDFSTPNNAKFICTIEGKRTIVDERLGGSVTLLKPDLRIISKDDILNKTRSVLEARGQDQRKYGAVERVQTSINVLCLMLPPLLLGVWFSLRRNKTTLGKTT